MSRSLCSSSTNGSTDTDVVSVYDPSVGMTVVVLLRWAECKRSTSEGIMEQLCCSWQCRGLGAFIKAVCLLIYLVGRTCKPRARCCWKVSTTRIIFSQCTATCDDGSERKSALVWVWVWSCPLQSQSKPAAPRSFLFLLTSAPSSPTWSSRSQPLAS